MKRVTYRTFALILILTVVFITVSACEKDNGSSGDSSSEINANSASTASTSMSIAKKTAATTGKTTISSTSSSSANITARPQDNVDDDTVNEIDEGSSVEEPQESVTDDEKEGNTVNERTFDLGGRTLKFLVSETTQPMNPLGAPRHEEDVVRTNLLKEAEKLYNCKFEFEYISGSWNAIRNIVVNSSMAGVYFADAFRMVKTNTAEMEKFNLILPLNDHIDWNQARWHDPLAGLNYGVLFPENIYSFGELSIHLPYALFYHESILGRDGIPMLSEYKAKNNWTWESFVDVATQTTKDTNGDGIIDQWGAATSDSSTVVRAFLYSNLEPLIALREGKYVYNLSNSKSMKALQFVSDLYNTYKVIPNKNAENEFFNGTAAMLIRDGWYGVTMRSKYPGQDIRYEEMPYGPDNMGNVTVQKNATNHRYHFPKSLENPDAVIEAFAYWQFTSDPTKNHYVDRNELVSMNAQSIIYDARDYEYYEDIYKSKSLKIEEYVDFFPPSTTRITNEVFNKIVAVNTTAASAVAALESEIESIIETTRSK